MHLVGLLDRDGPFVDVFEDESDPHAVGIERALQALGNARDVEVGQAVLPLCTPAACTCLGDNLQAGRHARCAESVERFPGKRDGLALFRVSPREGEDVCCLAGPPVASSVAEL